MVTYHLGLPNIGGILRELHPFLHYSERCKQVIKDAPMMAFRRPKSLQDYLPSCDLLFRILAGTAGLINVRVIDAMYAIILLLVIVFLAMLL